ncbi:unnamed protein product [Effrenium voratum]|nr:unnamed protein product [Effrenium voratum]
MGSQTFQDNAKNGIPLKFTVPMEARRPATKWRLYIFAKGNEGPKVIPIHKNVGYLFGKDRRIVDVPTDHPTCSKQHAVLHYRQTSGGVVKPYIMDLESVNGTFVNGTRIDAARYTELREKDVLKLLGPQIAFGVRLHQRCPKQQRPKLLLPVQQQRAAKAFGAHEAAAAHLAAKFGLAAAQFQAQTRFKSPARMGADAKVRPK